jgi:serine/threonine-protein kinase RsbT
MQDGYTTGGGLGLGLPGARRLVDDFALDSEPGRGTTVTLVKWSRT